jgi:hypothetical protein
VFVLMGMLWLAACAESADLSSNSSFDRWCEGGPCAWQTDDGWVKAVGTWHPKDLGVSFEATPSQISQFQPKSSFRCFLVDMVADVEAKARLVLRLDFNDDGVIDFEQQVPDVRWKTWPFVVRAPLDYQGLRFIVRKQGPGRAVLAQLRVVPESGCAGDRIQFQDGSSCRTHAVCQSGLCAEGHCQRCPQGGCDEGSPCASDAQCSEDTCVAGRCHTCAATGSCPALTPCADDAVCTSGRCLRGVAPSLIDRPEALGVCAACSGDAECAGTRCVHGLCAACVGHGDCPAGQVCRYGDSFDAIERTCLPPRTPPLARGALCEGTGDCELGLRCEAAEGLPARCGGSCAEQTDCPPERGELCTLPGAELRSVESEDFWVTKPNWADAPARVGTCAPLAPPGGLE